MGFKAAIPGVPAIRSLRGLGRFLWVILAWSLMASSAWCGDKIVIETAKGKIVVSLDSKAAPENVKFFIKHLKDRVYENSSFRSAADTYIFGGSPGPSARGYSSSGNMSCKVGAPAEFSLKHRRGALGMGRTVGACNPPKTSNSTQFGIYFADAPQNDGEFSVIGYVSEGMEVVDAIAAALKNEKMAIPISNVELISEK